MVIQDLQQLIELSVFVRGLGPVLADLGDKIQH